MNQSPRTALGGMAYLHPRCVTCPAGCSVQGDVCASPPITRRKFHTSAEVMLERGLYLTRLQEGRGFG